ncbi:conjugal transfer protein TrbJ [Serratia fonticola]|uniref:P-type conjugative transfer protein TrbJ n=1 Tax=Serratia fonticola TaxID=47917 RepID=UPI00217B9923|nr:P-type conjugative transfer protein TrbJ [Serratia fonticola]CAI2030319.1 conjugal transfer protein TrbJ [Serratia fonticola]
MKKLSLLPFILLASGYSLSAHAMYCSNCATNVQAAQSYLKEVASVANEMTGLEHQVESIGYQIQNLKNLPTNEWGDAINQLNQLGNIARQGDALAYSLSDINTQWQRRFKGYEGWEKSGFDPSDMSKQYLLWANTMQDTAKSSLNVAAQMAKVQQDDEQTINRIQQHSSGATGALQVLQASNELTAQTGRQLQKIQTLMQTDMQMTATTIATATEREEQQRAATDAVIAPRPPITGDGKDWSKPWNDTPTDWH